MIWFLFDTVTLAMLVMLLTLMAVLVIAVDEAARILRRVMARARARGSRCEHAILLQVTDLHDEVCALMCLHCGQLHVDDMWLVTGHGPGHAPVYDLDLYPCLCTAGCDGWTAPARYLAEAA